MYTALYRSQRPEIFSEVIGQDSVVKILRHQIETGTVSHAYLFCGTRGTGKTTTARILAKAVNCLSEADRPCGQCANCLSIKEGTFMDVIEIDAASNNGVENIRELRESVKYPPAVGRKKVYIIDEVHMLSAGASNALLKTLEEPPENVMFILATTDPQKLPQTILSRCMRLDFRRVPEKVLIAHMGRICRERDVEITEDALRLLASNADGSVRDGLSLLDQCLAAGEKKLNRDMLLEVLGTVSAEFFIELTERTALHDAAGALILLDRALQDGKDVKQLMKDWMSHYRNLLIVKYIRDAEDMLNMSAENIEKLRQQSSRISLDEINDGILTLSRTINDARYSTQPRILLELAIVTLASGLSSEPAEQGRRPRAAQLKTQPKPQIRPQADAAGEAAIFTREAAPAAAENAERQRPMEKKASAGGSAGGESQSRTAQEDYDLEEIWARIFEEGEDIKGSFNLIRTGAVLSGISGEDFKVIARSDFIREYVEQNQGQICQLMEKITGKKLKLICRTERQEETADKDEEAEKLARRVSEELHIDVRIE